MILRSRERCYTDPAVIRVQENIPLAPMTTLGIGGPARYFAEARTEDEVRDAVDFASSHDCGLLVLGGGSNLVVSDAGVDALVLRIQIDDTTFGADGNGSTVTAGAGRDWDSLVDECVARDLAGIECLSGIPGWVGATPVQNVGAYGQEVSSTIVRVRVFDRQQASVLDLTAADCGFAYRSSIFNATARGRYIILSVTYSLVPGGAPTVRYPDLERRLGSDGHRTLAEVRAIVCEVRAAKAMLLVDGDPDAKSVGSFFRNPIVSAADLADVEKRAALGAGESVPAYAVPGAHKIPAAWLIERAGFHRGTTRGPAAISSRHALALVNRGGATAEDVLGLAGEIQDGVFERFGIRLLPEPSFVGFAVEVVKRYGAVGLD